ncbi:MAG: BlaI/MecI/CopY family transcriptional regulator [Planctomycetes bacterium]|nr:BlaI/MecI/CopY family transcriptional regulator [Planctomycetota bacterium]
MTTVKKLPDSQFEIMRIIWRNTPPMSTNQIIACLGPEKTWTPQTVLTLLTRLIEKGFLHSEKIGKERTYSPLVTHEEYLRAETGRFFEMFHGNSVYSLVSALYDGKNLSEKEIAELRNWLEERGMEK